MKTASSPQNQKLAPIASWAVACAIAFAATATSQISPLSQPFGYDGRTSTDFGAFVDQGNAVAVDSQGRILVAGSTEGWGTVDRDIMLVRYQPDGSIDSSFGFYGFYSVAFDPVPGASDHAVAISVDAQDRIVVLARSAATDTSPRTSIIMDGPAPYEAARFDAYLGLARLLPNGGLDTSFGQGGKVFERLTPNNRGLEPAALVLEGSKIVVGGTIRRTPSDTDWFVAQFTSNGALDQTFNSVGYRLLWFDLGPKHIHDWLRDIAVTSNGDILAVGQAYGGPSGSWYTEGKVAKFNKFGNLVTGFGQGGVATWQMLLPREISMVLDDEDAPVISATTKIEAPQTSVGYEQVIGVAKFTNAGALDLSFANNGFGLFRFHPSFWSVPQKIVRRPDGTLLIVGSVVDENATLELMGALRLQSNGTPDSTFTPGATLAGTWSQPYWFGQVSADAWLNDAVNGPNGTVYAVGEVFAYPSSIDVALVKFAP